MVWWDVVVDDETRKALDAAWFADRELPGGGWIRVANCGANFRVRLWAWWPDRHWGGEVLELGKKLELSAVFINQ